jgi:hypothetical protein
MRVNRTQEFVIGGHTHGGRHFDALIFGKIVFFMAVISFFFKNVSRSHPDMRSFPAQGAMKVKKKPRRSGRG